jgi:hypothetical protein
MVPTKWPEVQNMLTVNQITVDLFHRFILHTVANKSGLSEFSIVQVIKTNGAGYESV